MAPAPPRHPASWARGTTNTHPQILVGSNPIPARTHAGWLRPRLRGAAVPIPSGEMLRSNIAEDLEPSLGHGGDLLLLGSSQVLQEASSAGQGQPSAGDTRGQGRWGRANHTTWHHTASTTRAGSGTKTPGTSRTTAGSIHAPQLPPSPSERWVMPPRLRDGDVTAHQELKAGEAWLCNG